MAGGWGRLQGEGVCVCVCVCVCVYIYTWLIHIVIWQEPTQHCKAIVLQLQKEQANAN